MRDDKILMTEDEMLEYGEKHMHFKKNVDEERVQKMIKLIERFGYKFHIGFMARQNLGRNLSNKKKNETSWYYRKTIDENSYIEIQIGKNGFGDTIFDVFKPDLNPETNKPWKIGDVKTVEGGRMAVLTRYGWNIGD